MSRDYKVAFIHYHLRPGGVTRVIEHQVEVLRRRGVRCAVLAGEPPAEGAAAVERVSVAVDGLGYSPGRSSRVDSGLGPRLEAAARSALGGDPDIWHLHNHSLGKNPALPAAALHLAESGRRLLLQIHDFAEDSRPEGYRLLRESLGGAGRPPLGQLLYPQASQIHYAVLNQRDRETLSACGVEASRLHHLPNAIAAASGGEVRTPVSSERAAGGSGGVLYIYPTRAIRRKNIGELLLWAAVSRAGERFATTLAPLNPVEIPRYERWVKVSRSLDLPVEFGIGQTTGLPLADLAASASGFVTTSIAEGFGMAFLEPWIFRRPLLGRDLPEITADFSTAGVDLSGLYRRLELPLEWIDGESLRQKIEAQLAATLDSYGRELSREAGERAWRAAVRGGLVDFGRLDEETQEAVIRRLRADPSLAGDLAPSALGAGAAPGAAVQRNEAAVRASFGLEAYGRSLVAAHESLLAESPGPVSGLDADRVLDRFLSPERFFLLRT